MNLWGKVAGIPMSLFVTSAVVLASSGVIIVISTNRVSNTTQTAYRWEPSAAAGTTWAHTWLEYPVSNVNVFDSYIGTWNGAVWGTPLKLTAPNFNSLDDVNLAWDSYRGRFVFAAHDGSSGQIFYGYYDSSGVHFTRTPASPTLPDYGTTHRLALTLLAALS